MNLRYVSKLMLAGALLLANVVGAAHAQSKNDRSAPKESKKSAPANNAAPRNQPAQNVAPARTNPAQRTETIRQSVTRMQSNPNEVDVSTRTGSFIGGAPAGPKSQLDGLTKQQGSIPSFDGARRNNPDAAVRPAPVQVPATTPTRPSTNGSTPSRPTNTTPNSDRNRQNGRRSNS